MWINHGRIPDPASCDVIVERLVAVRNAIAALPRDALNYRALLTELSAVITIDLDALTARIELSGEDALLFPGHARKP